MDMPVNRLKKALAAGEKQIGLWSSLCSPIVAEALAYSGYDWLLIDTEHSPNELPNVMGMMQAMALGTASPVVRPAWNDPVLLKRLLDAGTQSFLIPFVQSAEEAARAVSATRYPPEGIRGVALSHRGNRYGRVPDYVKKANQEICLLVQVESRAAVDAAADIAAVDGVDGVFIGPSDLAADLGHLGNPGHPEVQAAIAEVLKACQSAGTAAGILSGIEDQAKGYLDAGFSFVAVGSDLGLLTKHADALRESFK
ncbi:MAG: aldolase/citrate lyase family protein [Pseudomonadota bacterium]